MDVPQLRKKFKSFTMRVFLSLIQLANNVKIHMRLNYTQKWTILGYRNTHNFLYTRLGSLNVIYFLDDLYICSAIFFYSNTA
jgi:hypothetical protein